MKKIAWAVAWIMMVVIVIFMAALVAMGVRYAEFSASPWDERLALFFAIMFGYALGWWLLNRLKERYGRWEVTFDTSITVVQPVTNRAVKFLSHTNKKGEKRCFNCGRLIGLKPINNSYWQEKRGLWSLWSRSSLPTYCRRKCIPYYKK